MNSTPAPPNDGHLGPIWQPTCFRRVLGCKRRLSVRASSLMLCLSSDVVPLSQRGFVGNQKGSPLPDLCG